MSAIGAHLSCPSCGGVVFARSGRDEAIWWEAESEDCSSCGTPLYVEIGIDLVARAEVDDDPDRRVEMED